MEKNKSEARARQILRLHLNALEEKPELGLLSVVLVGSLTTGSYTGDDGSDIDLIHILRDDAPEESRQQVLEAIARTEVTTGRDIPISRCVYRYRDLFSPYPKGLAGQVVYKDYAELPIEIMRMKDSGQTVWGRDILDTIDYPSREDVLAGKEEERRWSEAIQEQTGFRPIAPEDLPMRLIVQSVLVRALLDYYFATGRSCSDKAAVAEKLGRDVPGYAFLTLVELCTRWRYRNPSFTSADGENVQRLWSAWLERRKGMAPGDVPCD